MAAVATAVAPDSCMTGGSVDGVCSRSARSRARLTSSSSSSRLASSIRSGFVRSGSGSSGAADRDDRGWTALHVASFVGDVEEVTRILAKDSARVDEQSSGPKHPGATALHLASVAGHVDVMEVLLDNGANIEARTKGSFGFTPLHLAAKADKRRAMRFLVESGAFLHPNRDDPRFNPPLHYCNGRGLEYAYKVHERLQRRASSCSSLLSLDEE